MLAPAFRAISNLTAPAFRSVLFKSIGLTLALLVAAWFGLTKLLDSRVELSNPWLETGFDILSGLGLFFGAIFLIVPVTTLIAGIFLDDIAEVVEQTDYPHEPVGKPLSFGEGIWTAVTFTAIVVAVNLLALPFYLILGLNAIVFLLANGYLLGREYFELAALRFHTKEEVKMLRRRHGGRIFLHGLMIGFLVSIPIVNLLTPLLATAMMVHLHKRLTGSAPVDIVHGSDQPVG